MKILFSITILLFVSFQSLSAKTFYIDPINGKIENDGSKESPWSTLEDVITSQKIKSYHYLPLPYSSESKLEIFNMDAPISAGDTLILLPGQHGSILLRGYYNPETITILAKKGDVATFESLRISAASNWNIVGITVNPFYYAFSDAAHLIHIESHGWHGPCSHVDIVNCQISSGFLPWTTADEWLDNAKNGIVVDADSIQLINNSLNIVRHGISLKGDFNSAINNEIINFSGDASRILGSNNLFDGNLIKNCYKVDENHDDGIQSYTTGEITVDNNVIRNNIILNYEDPNQPLLGPLQGMGFFDGPYRNWIVENNLVIVDHWHGITFLGGYDCIIQNNTVLDPTPNVKPGPSWIMIDNDKDGTPSLGCVVQNNVTNDLQVDGIADHNQILMNTTDYQNNFVDFLISDFHLLKSSVLVDAGDSLTATQFDIEGNLRTIGSPDIGAYEYSPPVFTQNIKNIKVTLYPNPISNELSNLGNLKDFQLTILDVNGIQKMQINLKNNNNSILLNQIPKGIYFLQFYNKADGTILVRKIIKM